MPKKVSDQEYYVRKKDMIRNHPTDIRMRNLRQKVDMGKKPVLILVPGSRKRLAFKKGIMCAKNMGAHVQCTTLESQRYEKTGREIDSPAAKKGVKKLVSSNCAKIIE